MQRREACACYVYVYVSTLGQAEKARNLRPVKVKLAYHYYMITMQVWWRCGVELEWGEGVVQAFVTSYLMGEATATRLLWIFRTACSTRVAAVVPGA